MAQQREGMPTWLSVYPVDQETSGLSPERPVFIDVGGGLGHQCAALKDKYPSLPGRVILQDLPHAIQAALSTPDVEKMEHDFFKRQPIKGRGWQSLLPFKHDLTYHQLQEQNTTTCVTSSMIIPTTNAW